MPCSKSEFADFVLDLSLKVEINAQPDRVIMRYVNAYGVVCASSEVDLRSGVESDWMIDRDTPVELIVDPHPYRHETVRDTYRARSPRPTDEELLAAFSSGQSVVEISEKYEIPRIYVYRRIWSHPDYPERKYKRMREMIDLHTAGVSHAKIAEIFGITKQSVSSRLLRWGYSRKGVTSRRDVVNSEINEKYLSGVRVKDLAEQYGVTTQSIYGRIKKAQFKKAILSRR